MGAAYEDWLNARKWQLEDQKRRLEQAIFEIHTLAHNGLLHPGNEREQLLDIVSLAEQL